MIKINGTVNVLNVMLYITNLTIIIIYELRRLKIKH